MDVLFEANNDGGAGPSGVRSVVKNMCDVVVGEAAKEDEELDKVMTAAEDVGSDL